MNPAGYGLKFTVEYGDKMQELLIALSKKEDFLRNSCVVYGMAVEAEKSGEYASVLKDWYDKKVSTVVLRDNLIKPLYDLDKNENFDSFLSLDSAQLKLK